MVVMFAATCFGMQYMNICLINDGDTNHVLQLRGVYSWQCQWLRQFPVLRQLVHRTLFSLHFTFIACHLSKYVEGSSQHIQSMAFYCCKFSYSWFCVGIVLGIICHAVEALLSSVSW